MHEYIKIFKYMLHSDQDCKKHYLLGLTVLKQGAAQQCNKSVHAQQYIAALELKYSDKKTHKKQQFQKEKKEVSKKIQKSHKSCAIINKGSRSILKYCKMSSSLSLGSCTTLIHQTSTIPKEQTNLLLTFFLINF